MESSDEEGEIVPHTVTDYQLLNLQFQPVSFAVLPLHRDQTDDQSIISSETHVFLLGSETKNELQKIHKRVLAWSFDLSSLHPNVSVLSKDMKWIELRKPMKSFENSVRAVFVTLHWLQFMKKNPETSARELWNYLLREFRSFEIEPCGKDLFDHMSLITEAFQMDKNLTKCKNPLMLMERPRDDTEFNENPLMLVEKPRDDADSKEVRKTTSKPLSIVDMDEDEDDKDDEGSDDGLYDHVCAICDNGGELLSCQGKCMRSFHATVNSGAGSCETLRFHEAQLETMQTFLCPNCKYKHHQCFVCGKLGSSDSVNAEVFACASLTCGHFYHPQCVAKVLEPVNNTQALMLQGRIAVGESFTCPLHRCFVCKKGEDKKLHESQFAICRRCPKAYHRKCLPRAISYEKSYDGYVFQRAWDDIIPNRVLIYCMDHEIVRELETPARDHIRFPQVNVQQQKLQRCGFHSIKRKWNGTNGFNAYDLARSAKENFVSASRTERRLPMHRNSRNGINAEYNIKKTAKGAPSSSSDQAEMENGILALIRECNSSVNRDEFMKRKRLTASFMPSSTNFIEETITTAKVEGSIKAIQTALKKLDEGCSIDVAKAICEPQIIDQIFKWKTTLNIYLAPFLHGMRYTSFGRHFTHLDKLREVANRLHCYVENGDTIVDFCCGSNDFSVLMREELQKTGKRCFFKNFDIIIPKDDYCFEKRDWMSIKPEELPIGSQLIMGLNPPFGKANKFINKALQFKPKLLVLIVPEETQRLDGKRLPYDLIWSDKLLLSGKSFYLPGSVDGLNKPLEDWNMKPPPLYLWSRPDWSIRHREIALQHRHLTHVPLPSYHRFPNCVTQSYLTDGFAFEENEPRAARGRGGSEILIQRNCNESDMVIDTKQSSSERSPAMLQSSSSSLPSPGNRREMAMQVVPAVPWTNQWHQW